MTINSNLQNFELIRIDSILNQLLVYLKDNFGLNNSLLGFYKLGSLTHGGYNSYYSDIDVAIIAHKEIDPIFIESAKKELIKWDNDMGIKVSLFWTDRSFSSGRFPVLDQIDFLDNRELIFEKERILPKRPSVDMIRNYLLSHPIEYWTEKSNYFSKLRVWNELEAKELLRCLLYPARFIYTYSKGLMTSNDEAVSFLRKLHDNNFLKYSFQDFRQCQLSLELIEEALTVRNLRRSAQSLFIKHQSKLIEQHQSILNWIQYEKQKHS